jgi:hypothetical protein
MSALAKRITRALGGDWYGSYGLIPGPGHSPKDRSVSIRPHRSDPNDVVIHSFAGDDDLAVKDELRHRGLLPERSGRPRSRQPLNAAREPAPAAQETEEVRKRLGLARWLWRRSQPIAGTLAERYLRARGIEGDLSATLRFLPASGRHPSTMIAAFGLPDEPEPGLLRIEMAAIRGVHLTKLRADGLGKADVDKPKTTRGKGHSLPIVLAPVNDGLGLAITEGIEDALSVHLAQGLGVWAAGSASRMPGLAEHVPEYVECITVFIDADPAGERHGPELMRRLRARGFKVIAKCWARVRRG